MKTYINRIKVFIKSCIILILTLPVVSSKGNNPENKRLESIQWKLPQLEPTVIKNDFIISTWPKNKPKPNIDGKLNEIKGEKPLIKYLLAEGEKTDQNESVVRR